MLNFVTRGLVAWQKSASEMVPAALTVHRRSMSIRIVRMCMRTLTCVCVCLQGDACTAVASEAAFPLTLRLTD